MKTETPWDWFKRCRSESYWRGYWVSKVEDVCAMIIGVLAWMVYLDWDHLLRGMRMVLGL